MPAERTDFQSVRAPQIVRKSRPDEFLDSTGSVFGFTARGLRRW
jgi:hypothetical protein